MPELPEVETIKSQLHSTLPFKISSAFFNPQAQRIIKQKDFDPTGFTIVKIKRHAKWLIFELEPYGYILSHLGMSGSWRMSSEPLQDKHGHIEFINKQKLFSLSKKPESLLSNNLLSQKARESHPSTVLTYVDPRRFGHFYLLNKENFERKMLSFPMDVTSPNFDEDHIAELFFRFPHKMIKPFLLDQKFFPGVGNYMASEICARAGVLPTRLAGGLEAREILKIKEALHTVIAGAIATKGTTFGGGYRDAQGSKGDGVKNLVVFYQKDCQLCRAEDRRSPVTKFLLGGRGTYYCSHCQK